MFYTFDNGGIISSLWMHILNSVCDKSRENFINLKISMSLKFLNRPSPYFNRNSVFVIM